jgi:hypothetical protein
MYFTIDPSISFPIENLINCILNLEERRSKMKKQFLTFVTLLVICNLILVSPVFAYSGSSAKTYADNYATSPNSGVYPVFGSEIKMKLVPGIFLMKTGVSHQEVNLK